MLKIGLCGWTIGMREYFERFPVVEVQQTFYEPPAQAPLRRWRESAPEGFEFTLKAWQLTTHKGTSPTYRRLKTVLSSEERVQAGAFQDTDIVRKAWETTADCAAILKATMVLFQCPASLTPSSETVANMRTFFRQADRHSLRFLWEPRGSSWPAELIRTLCNDLDLVHVVDPFVNPTVTPDLVYYRLHGITGARHRYSDGELQRLMAMLPSRDVPAYVLFNEIPRDEDSARFERMLRRST
jgi:uncharacterized protein YecE (DUF72 family)